MIRQIVDQFNNLTFKEKTDVVKSVVTIFAIIIGGYWAFHLVVKERKHEPHANIQHTVENIILSEDICLLRVVVEIKNTGSSILESTEAIIRIQEILPIEDSTTIAEEVRSSLEKVVRDGNSYKWPLISERVTDSTHSVRIEPGETEFIDFEFAISRKLEVVRIYSYFHNDSSNNGKGIGWAYSSYYHL